MTLPAFLQQRRAEVRERAARVDRRSDPDVIAARAYKVMDHALRRRVLEARAQEPPVSVRKIAAAEDLSVARIYALLREMEASGYQPPTEEPADVA